MFEQVLSEGLVIDGVRVGGGWQVDVQALTFNPPHKDKHVMVNDVLSERHEHLFMLRFDELKAKATIVSIEASPIHANYEKDKSSERPGFDQEKATHLSDTTDYYVIWRLRGGSAAFDDFDVGWL